MGAFLSKTEEQVNRDFESADAKRTADTHSEHVSSVLDNTAESDNDDSEDNDSDGDKNGDDDTEDDGSSEDNNFEDDDSEHDSSDDDGSDGDDAENNKFKDDDNEKDGSEDDDDENDDSHDSDSKPDDLTVNTRQKTRPNSNTNTADGCPAEKDGKTNSFVERNPLEASFQRVSLDETSKTDTSTPGHNFLNSEEYTQEQKEFAESFERIIRCAEKQIRKESFGWRRAKRFFAALVQKTESQRNVGRLDEDLEPVLLSRCYRTVEQFAEGRKSFSPRQTQLYMYSALAVFPRTMQLTRASDGIKEEYSAEGKLLSSKFNRILDFCKGRVALEYADGTMKYAQDQHLLLEFAMWLESVRPAVTHLIVSHVTSDVTSHMTEAANGMEAGEQKNDLEKLLHLAAVLKSSCLIKQDYFEDAQEALASVKEPEGVPPWFEVKLLFVESCILHNQQENVKAFDKANRALGLCQSEPEKLDLQGLVNKVKDSLGGGPPYLTRVVLNSSLKAQGHSPDGPKRAYETADVAFWRELLSTEDSLDTSDTDSNDGLDMSDMDSQDGRDVSDTDTGDEEDEGTREEVTIVDLRDLEFTLNDEDEKHLEEEDTRDWFERSQDPDDSKVEYWDTEIDIELSEEQETRNQTFRRDSRFYKDLITDREELKRLLQEDPKTFKRCRLVIESPQRSVAKMLDLDDELSEIVIQGRSRCGQTYMNDEVLVKILWNPTSNAERDRNTECLEHDMGEEIYGEVIGLFERKLYTDMKHPQFFCTLDERYSYRMKPICKTVPAINVLNDSVRLRFPSMTQFRVEIKKIGEDGNIHHKKFINIEPGKREQYVFRVMLLVWKKDYAYPLGVVLDAFCGGRSYNSGLRVLTMQHGVPTIYPPEVVCETMAFLEAPDEMVEDGRKDLTERTVFTIDSQDSRHLDDALSLWSDGKHYVVGIHIADVTSVILEDTAVNAEARKRGFSFYPLDQNPHLIIPEPIAKECSLLQNKKRKAISVLFTFSEDLLRTDDPVDVKKTLIKSERQLTYKQVHQIIQTDASDSDIENSIRTLNEIARSLRRQRLGNSIFFVPFEDPRLHDPRDLQDTADARDLVEEFMILTNKHIAEMLTERFPKLMLLRCHKTPTYPQLDRWRNREGSVSHMVMQLQGKNITPDTLLSFEHDMPDGDQVIAQAHLWQKLCRHLTDGELEEARRIAFMDDLHPLQCLASNHWMDLMETAQYRCSHGLNQPEHYHFGLGLQLYTHFTSPIRRYADLHVHRLLHAHLDGTPPGCSSDEVMRLCQHLNGKRERASAFCKGNLSLNLAKKLKIHPLVFRGFVEQVDSERLTLLMPSFRSIKQELPFSSLVLGSQPELSHGCGNGQNRIVSVKWSTRRYDTQNLCPRDFVMVRKRILRRTSPEDPLVIPINPEYLSVRVDQSEWAAMLKSLTVETFEDTPSSVSRGGLAVTHMSSEKGDGTVSLRPCFFQMVYSPGQVLKVQMAADACSGVLQPRLDLVHTTRNASVCTRHVEKPVLTLSRYYIRRSIHHAAFDSYENYFEAWMPLLEMEAAYGAGGSDVGFVVENVHLSLSGRRDDTSRVTYTATFSLDAQFCFDRCIEIGGKNAFVAEKTRPGIKSQYPLDYLCIRCKAACPDQIVSQVKEHPLSAAFDKNYTWIAHAWVVDVQKREKREGAGSELFVVCEFRSPLAPPESLMAVDKGVTVEVLPKSPVERRAQEKLVQLGSSSKLLRLAKAMAYGKDLPPLKRAHLALGKRCCYNEVHDDSCLSDDIPLLPKNNTMQRQALKKALTSSLCLIQGPPGTGKTYTGVKLVYLFCKINRELQAAGKGKKTVLFCGPSNKSVDLVAWYLKHLLCERCPKIVRMYGSAIENKDYPTPYSITSWSRSARNLKSDPRLKKITLHHIIRQKGKSHAEKLGHYKKEFEKFLNDPEGCNISRQKLREMMEEYHKCVDEASRQELGKYEVVLTTCSVGGNRRLVKGTRESVFQVIIDECGMSPEPHSMVPIVANQAQQVVLLGDHKQLRPIITYQPAADLGLNQSLFERLAKKYRENLVVLDTQYRMHENLCKFVSETFYEPEGVTLKTCFSYKDGKAPLPFWPRDLWRGEVPHILVDVRGVERTLTVSTVEGNIKSKSNPQEAEKVVEIIQFLTKTHKVPLNNIKVLTQYNAQRHLLEQMISNEVELERIPNVQSEDSSGEKSKEKVSTVVSSQGSEWDYVILSTVRSLPFYKMEPYQSLGFLSDRNQMNVALSRAKKGLIIVGNLEMLRCAGVWERLVTRYQKLHCVRDPAEFPFRQARKRENPKWPAPTRPEGSLV